VFTARYALSPYIKQIRFVFKGLNSVNWKGALKQKGVKQGPVFIAGLTKGGAQLRSLRRALKIIVQSKKKKDLFR
jgi:hypothetical protein